MTVSHPFLAEAAAYGAAMAEFELFAAYATAIVALVLALLPWKYRVTRWFCVGFALLSIYLIEESYRLNRPLPWSILVLFLPVAIAFTSVFLSVRLSHARRK